MVIGITGGIGSGKSAVVEILKGKGLPVLSADAISHEIMTPGSEVVERLASVFGADILVGEERALDRKCLADKAFARPENTAKLNEIVQNAIRTELTDRMTVLKYRDPEQLIIVEIPLLYEAGWDDLCDKVWCITASEKVRISRVMQRDGLSRRQAKMRVKRQMDEGEKTAKADVVIYNEGSMEELNEKVEKALQYMRTEK